MLEYFRNSQTTKLEGIREAYLLSLEENGSFSNIEAYMDLLPEKVSILEYAKDPILIFDDCSAIMGEQKIRTDSQAAMFGEILADDSAFGCELLYLWEAEAFLEKHKRKLIDMEGLQPQALFAKRRE